MAKKIGKTVIKNGNEKKLIDLLWGRVKCGKLKSFCIECRVNRKIVLVATNNLLSPDVLCVIDRIREELGTVILETPGNESDFTDSNIIRINPYEFLNLKAKKNS